MYTSKQAITDMIRAMGPQDLSALVRECRTQATDNPTRESVKAALVEMVTAGEMFTDGEVYSDNPDDVDTVDAGMEPSACEVSHEELTANNRPAPHGDDDSALSLDVVGAINDQSDCQVRRV
jgi:hypothetical protein